MSDNDKLLNYFNQIAKSIREHNRIHQKKEPNSFFISEYLEKAADLFDKIADGDIQIVKHGYWISKDILIECSNCKKTLIRDNIEKTAVYENGLPTYCPHCGAKMDGGTTND